MCACVRACVRVTRADDFIIFLTCPFGALSTWQVYVCVCMYVCLCACVRACVRERERERERESVCV